MAGGPVAGGQVQAVDAGQAARQQHRLQGVGQLMLGVVEAGAVQRLGDEPGHRHQDGALRPRMVARSLVGEDEGADDAV